MKIYLFETSPKYGFAGTGADRCGPQENNFLCGGLDCLLFGRAFVERCTQRAKSVSNIGVRVFSGGSVA